MAAAADERLAPYALHDAQSAGRRYPEPAHAYRGPFQRDRDRLIHSSSFRRLSNKTQVFTGVSDYHRTRLTHTLEVVSISRTLARALRLNEDLVEALALAHDLGHPPFGHAGEETLDACLREVGGFSHNRQALRIVEELEQRYPDFPGLNLSREVLEGQQIRSEKGARAVQPLLEVQVVDAADSVAYTTHDVDDALEVGLLSEAELYEVPLWQQAAVRVRQRYAELEGKPLRRAVLHELIDWQVGDLLAQATERLHRWQVNDLAAVRRAPVAVSSGDALADMKAEFEGFLYQRVYRHPQVLKMRQQAQASLAALFAWLCERPKLLPAGFYGRIEHSGLARTVGDYLAGMTDRFAQEQFKIL